MSTAALLKLRSDVQEKAPDPFKNGSVIRWKKRYETPGRGGRRSYTYAALRAGKRWYVTGPMAASSGISYESLVRKLSEEGVSDISLATEWTSTGQTKKSRRAKMTGSPTSFTHDSVCVYAGQPFSKVSHLEPDCSCNL